MEIRPIATDAERDAWLAFNNETWPEQAMSAGEFDSYRLHVPERIDLVGWLHGGPVAGALAALEPGRPAHVAYSFLRVDPGRRGHGFGARLYKALSRWTRDAGRESLEGWVTETESRGIAWAERRGFVEVSRDARVALDLVSVPAPDGAPPDGITITTYAERPDLDRAIYEVAVEAYADEPGSEEAEMESFEEWRAGDLHGAGDRPEATFLALAGGEVVGYAKFHFSDARPDLLLHDMTGVKRAWRGRGIGKALKAAEIAWAKAAGYGRLETNNEVRNAPIRRINERFGYRPIPGRVLLRGPLAAA